MASYVTFCDVPIEGRKTRLVEVVNTRYGDLLGQIRWYGAWRQYVFAPEPDCEFSDGCLQDVRDHIAMLNQQQRAQKQE